MSTLRSALDEFRAEDLRRTTHEDIEGELCELERASRILEAERARRVAEVERREVWRADGYLSVVSWISARLRLGWQEAASQVRIARALEHMPATIQAYGSGEVSSRAVGMLVGARGVAPEAFDASEQVLVEAARGLSPDRFRAAVAYWRQAAEPDRVEDDARHAFQRRHLYVSPTLDGTVRVDADLDPECGQTLITALRSVEDAWLRADRESRSPAQRRADALGELCRSWLDSSDRPTVAGGRPAPHGHGRSRRPGEQSRKTL